MLTCRCGRVENSPSLVYMPLNVCGAPRRLIAGLAPLLTLSQFQSVTIVPCFPSRRQKHIYGYRGFCCLDPSILGQASLIFFPPRGSMLCIHHSQSARMHGLGTAVRKFPFSVDFFFPWQIDLCFLSFSLHYKFMALWDSDDGQYT